MSDATYLKTDATITKTVILAAPREVVWEFLTLKDRLSEWFHPADADLAEGRDFALMAVGEDGAPKKLCWGTVQRMDPPTTLVYSFTVGPLNGVMTTVTWTLEDIDGGTRLTLVHEGLEAARGVPFDLLRALDSGWDEHLASLRRATA